MIEVMIKRRNKTNLHSNSKSLIKAKEDLENLQEKDQSIT